MAEPPGPEDLRKQEREEDAHERAVLFSNETFTIGMLQAVSGASLFAALAQWDNLSKLAGRVPSLIFLTSMGAALITGARRLLQASVQDVGREAGSH